MEATIYLGTQSPMHSCDLPKADTWLMSSLIGVYLHLILLQIGFTEPIRHRIAGELLPHRFILTVDICRIPQTPLRRFAFCCTSRQVTLPGR